MIIISFYYKLFDLIERLRVLLSVSNLFREFVIFGRVKRCFLVTIQIKLIQIPKKQKNMKNYFLLESVSLTLFFMALLAIMGIDASRSTSSNLLLTSWNFDIIRRNLP